ncbi:MAG: hypothetical protein A3C56_07055 [Ignavibacteria bacterium RIFCSPHIGHO2_02_FULL_56_12]|nr:MAG: hypothetical protein A3C56_07055 [Ignavibacteria bacterium RIFCSPHIGHO2_02_FULL_56_12]
MGRRVKQREGKDVLLVSIVLCTFNRASLLPRALSSVLRQTYGNWELIVVDDGSTDRTAAAVNRFIAREPRITMFRQRNRGLALARNAGIRRTNGDFICFLDSDDAYAADHVAWRVRWMNRHPRIDMIYGGLRVRGPRSKQYVVDLERPGQKLHVSQCYVGGTFFLRRNVLRKVGGFRKMEFGEDYDLMKRIERRFNVRKVGKRSYIYYCDSPDRLCDLFTEKLLKKEIREEG